jgi:hypothetical protein
MLYTDLSLILLPNLVHRLKSRVEATTLKSYTVEHEVGSSTHALFGFNGTAGVWRINALNEAGGWKDRTTVEDMDLAVRAMFESLGKLCEGKEPANGSTSESITKKEVKTSMLNVGLHVENLSRTL